MNDKQESALWALLGASVKLADHIATYGKDASPDLSEKWHEAVEHALAVAPFQMRKPPRASVTPEYRWSEVQTPIEDVEMPRPPTPLRRQRQTTKKARSG